MEHVTVNDWRLEKPIALNVPYAPQNLNLTAASSVNMETIMREPSLCCVEDFSPQPSPDPADFSDSDRDEREEEETWGFRVRLYMFEPLSTASRERERQPAHPPSVWPYATVDNWQHLYDGGAYSRKNFIGRKINIRL